MIIKETRKLIGFYRLCLALKTGIRSLIRQTNKPTTTTTTKKKKKKKKKQQINKQTVHHTYMTHQLATNQTRNLHKNMLGTDLFDKHFWKRFVKISKMGQK